MFNQITLIGNLVKDIDLKTLDNNVQVAKSSVAASHKYKATNGNLKEEVCFVDFAIFGKLAQTANEYLHKGSKVFLQGRLVQNNWTDKNGNSRTSFYVNVETIKFLSTKPSNSNASTEAHTQEESPVVENQQEKFPF